MITTSIIFIAGIGVGAVCAVLLFLFILRIVARDSVAGNKAREERVNKYNEQSLKALEHRNEIDERIFGELRQLNLTLHEAFEDGEIDASDFLPPSAN